MFNFFFFFLGVKNEDDSFRQEEIVLRLRSTLEREKTFIIRQVERQINELTHQVINEVRDTNLTDEKRLASLQDKSKTSAL